MADIVPIKKGETLQLGPPTVDSDLQKLLARLENDGMLSKVRQGIFVYKIDGKIYWVACGDRMDSQSAVGLLHWCAHELIEEGCKE